MFLFYVLVMLFVFLIIYINQSRSSAHSHTLGLRSTRNPYMFGLAYQSRRIKAVVCVVNLPRLRHHRFPAPFWIFGLRIGLTFAPTAESSSTEDPALQTFFNPFPPRQNTHSLNFRRRDGYEHSRTKRPGPIIAYYTVEQ